MSTLKVTNLQTAAGVTNLSINASTGQVTAPSGLEPTIINRGNPSNISQLLLLSSFNEIHYYETTGSSLNLTTEMLPNSIYELTWTSSGGAENTDFALYPNGLTYGSNFNSHYRHTTGSTGNFDQLNQIGLNFIYFDHQGGGDGNNGMGRLIMHSGTETSAGFEDKMAMYFGADDGTNVAYGYSRWTVSSIKWSWVGLLSFSGDNKRCWIRRQA